MALAEAYIKLECSGTYYLTFRDLPGIIFASITGKKAVEFVCSTGRSARFLKNCGVRTVGIDNCAGIIIKARET